MKVILIKDIPKVGKRYEIKEFSDGYANNALIAKGLAVKATPRELENLKKMQNSSMKKQADEDKLFLDLVANLENSKLVLKVKSNEKGNLFSAVHGSDIVKVIKDTLNITIDEDLIVFDSLIKEVGVHYVRIKKGDKENTFPITIQSK